MDKGTLWALESIINIKSNLYGGGGGGYTRDGSSSFSYKCSCYNSFKSRSWHFWYTYSAIVCQRSGAYITLAETARGQRAIHAITL